jgi:hypothetical protein
MILLENIHFFCYLKKVLNDELSVLLANQDSFERQMISIKNLVFVFKNEK